MTIDFIKNIFILSLLLVSTNSGTISEFEKNYKFEITLANDHYNRLEAEFINQSKKYGTDYKFISAIVFPELIRYSMFRDFLKQLFWNIFMCKKEAKPQTSR